MLRVNNMRLRQVSIHALALLAAFVPLLVFAYSGTFSRLYADDYGHLGKVLESGAWESLLFWRVQWNGDYTNFLVFGMLAPLGAAAPLVFLPVIIVLGLAGMAWLTRKLFTFLSLDRQSNLVVAALAALLMSATFHSFYSNETLYWLSASVEYSLPTVILFVLIALAWEVTSRLDTRLSLAICALAAGGAAFINAGFSEMYMVFQNLFLLLLLVCLFAFLRGTRRRIASTLCAASLLGSLASLPVQLSSAGFIHRVDVYDSRQLRMPIRDPLQLLFSTLEETVQRAGYEQAFAGFMLAFAGGMLVALALGKPVTEKPRAESIALKPVALALLLLAQLAYLPILWSHTSDSMTILGRFSPAYFLVIVLNAGFVLLFSFQFIQHRRISAWLAQPNASLLYVSAHLLAVLLLFALSQFRSIHWRAASYMFASALSLIVFLAWQMKSGARSPTANALLLVATVSAVVTALAFVGLTAVQFWGAGRVIEKVYTMTAFLLTISALIWGLCLGHSLQQAMLRSPLHSRWIRASITIWLAVALAIGSGIASVTARRSEARAAFAAIWDEQHQEILRLRDAGDPAVHTMQLALRLSRDRDADVSRLLTGTIHERIKMFYGLDYQFLQSE